jgi:hypothetical protein
LAAGAYDADARITALDELRIDLQAISPSPTLLFYWEEPTTRWQWVTLILSEKSGCSTYPTEDQSAILGANARNALKL